MTPNTGATTIVGLAALCGALVAWNIVDIAADIKARRAAQVAERNLDQAESMLKACFDHRVFIVGTAIYRCRAVESDLTTAHLPELNGGAL